MLWFSGYGYVSNYEIQSTALGLVGKRTSVFIGPYKCEDINKVTQSAKRVNLRV